MFYVMPDFKFWNTQLNYIVEFEFEKSSSHLNSTINKSLKKKHLKEPFSEEIKTKIKSKQTMKQNLSAKKIETLSL